MPTSEQQEQTYPVVYYYPGKAGTLQHFGHVAIALDKENYLTFGEDKGFRHQCSVDAGVGKETETYLNPGEKPFIIPLPPPPEKYDTPEKKGGFLDWWNGEFPGNKYNLLTKNCAHSVSACLSKLGFGRLLGLTDNTRPSTVAKRACAIQLEHLENEFKEIEMKNINPKEKLEMLLDNRIKQLEIQLIQDNVGKFGKASEFGKLSNEAPPPEQKTRHFFQRRQSMTSLNKKQIELEALTSLRQSMSKKDISYVIGNLKKLTETSGDHSFEKYLINISDLKASSMPQIEEEYQKNKIQKLVEDLSQDLSDSVEKNKKMQTHSSQEHGKMAATTKIIISMSPDFFFSLQDAVKHFSDHLMANQELDNKSLSDALKKEHKDFKNLIELINFIQLEVRKIQNAPESRKLIWDEFSSTVISALDSRTPPEQIMKTLLTKFNERLNDEELDLTNNDRKKLSNIISKLEEYVPAQEVSRPSLSRS